MSTFDPDRWSAVVFDVDGTLYEQSRLRRKMALELIGYCLVRPWRIGLLKRLQVFRRERERISDEEVEGANREQFERPAAKLGVPVEILEADFQEWIEHRPLRHLVECRVPGVRRFFAMLRARDIRIVALSDYPAADKLAALGLEADLVVSGIDPGVDRLKPHPAGLLAVLAQLELPPDRVLMIGDRDDRDGECSRRAGVECLLRGRGSFMAFTELIR